MAPVAIGDDPDYQTGGSDELLYSIPLDQLSGEPKSVLATLYYQSVPPYYLQDRLCTSASDDTKRLYYLVGKLGLAEEPLKGWKLKIGQSTIPSCPDASRLRPEALGLIQPMGVRDIAGRT